ncbi:kelch-like protein [Pectobacterium phage vB_PcaM_CBB]|uniref:Kelch-like protein n=1 Tax=Pectobacterium phage vB_PcaM_CBB TaxID=2772511 RepID=A0A1L2CVR1_9CAUD|nr:kelch-like protein [Pectobacterium phage vB_PcaM_CBB]AMM44113.1 kelch-like protein [Pectobacterium phage vB_PcaM_CBB]
MLPFPRLIEYGNIRKENNTGTRIQISPTISPSARFSFGYTSLDNYGYMYGGAVVGSDYNNEFWRFDTRTETWEPLANGTLAMHGSGLAGYNGKIYMFGGYTGSMQNRFFIYDISSNTWSENTTSTNKPSARHHCRFVSTNNGKLYLWGSDGGSQLFSYDIASNAWTTLTSSSITNSLAGDMTTDGNYLYCQGSSGQKFLISTGTWSSMASMQGRMTYNEYNDAIYCVNAERLYKYSISTNTWSQVGFNTSVGISRGALYTSLDGVKVYSMYGYSTSPINSQYRFQ